MDGSIRQRVIQLRREVAEIARLSMEYLQTPRPAPAEKRDQQSREQRLKEIMDELKSIIHVADRAERKP